MVCRDNGHNRGSSSSNGSVHTSRRDNGQHPTGRLPPPSCHHITTISRTPPPHSMHSLPPLAQLSRSSIKTCVGGCTETRRAGQVGGGGGCRLSAWTRGVTERVSGGVRVRPLAPGGMWRERITGDVTLGTSHGGCHGGGGRSSWYLCQCGISVCVSVVSVSVWYLASVSVWYQYLSCCVSSPGYPSHRLTSLTQCHSSQNKVMGKRKSWEED